MKLKIRQTDGKMDSVFGRINIYRFKVIPIKLPMAFFPPTELEWPLNSPNNTWYNRCHFLRYRKRPTWL